MDAFSTFVCNHHRQHDLSVQYRRLSAVLFVCVQFIVVRGEGYCDQPGMRDSVSVAGTPPSIAQWVTEVRKPSYHGKVQSLRDGSCARIPFLGLRLTTLKLIQDNRQSCSRKVAFEQNITDCQEETTKKVCGGGEKGRGKGREKTGERQVDKERGDEEKDRWIEGGKRGCGSEERRGNTEEKNK
ncbi:hypothetical protein CSKR_109005 [Clonorchis sinensis]|uniref:Uncharacterized protein n=1 Tax=Clonorchis sinensis TaxID=79923 RepID=A0A419PV33_CLOSI|nr:hypothetical protein CSKR_109005 [Clonorchis sinensis]